MVLCQQPLEIGRKHYMGCHERHPKYFIYWKKKQIEE